jgi:hypothetical protein
MGAGGFCDQSILKKSAAAAAVGSIAMTQTATCFAAAATLLLVQPAQHALTATGATSSFAAAAALLVVQLAHDSFATTAATCSFATAAALFVMQTVHDALAAAAATTAATTRSHNNRSATSLSLVLEEELGSLNASGHSHHQNCAKHRGDSFPKI